MRRTGIVVGIILMLMAAGCGSETKMQESAIELQTPEGTVSVEEDEPLTSDADMETEENWEDHLMPLPDELKSMDAKPGMAGGNEKYTVKKQRPSGKKSWIRLR